MLEGTGGGRIVHEGWPDSVPILQSMCEALANWGDTGKFLNGVCRALVEGLSEVDVCVVYIGGNGGEATLAGRFPGTGEDDDVEEMRSFAQGVIGAEGIVARRLGDDSMLFGQSGATRSRNRIVIAARSGPALSGGGHDNIRLCLGFAVHLAVRALDSLGSIESKMEDRAMQRLRMMRSEMIATLSHEIRTPLAGIKGYVTALLRKDVDWDERTRLEFLQVIADESDKMEKMTASILDMAAMETGKVTLERSPTLLPRLVSEVVSKIGMRGKKHRFLVDFASDFPVMAVDPLRIEQVVYNMIDNAVKYSPDGGLIVVSGRVHPDHVVLGVADQGKGIPAEHLNRLFEKFFRIGSEERVGGRGVGGRGVGGRGVGGLGLGLPIARRLVEAHGGRIWAESAEGKGTTVYFTLPLEVNREDPQ